MQTPASQLTKEWDREREIDTRGSVATSSRGHIENAVEFCYFLTLAPKEGMGVRWGRNGCDNLREVGYVKRRTHYTHTYGTDSVMVNYFVVFGLERNVSYWGYCVVMGMNRFGTRTYTLQKFKFKSWTIFCIIGSLWLLSGKPVRSHTFLYFTVLNYDPNYIR